MVETKRNALPLERGKALPAQNHGITAEWQGTSSVQGDVVDCLSAKKGKVRRMEADGEHT
jgi:hypothetical protein